MTRLAPSPTGALHLGNARTFLLNCLLARRMGWRTLMRVEDIDGPRVKAGAEAEALDDLAWLGLEWDGPVVRQSQRRREHLDALDELVRAGVAYPCTCSRGDVESAAAAPHADDPAAGVYPGTCRLRWRSAEQAATETGRQPAWRVMAPDREMAFEDAFAGPVSFNLASACGDFVIFRGNREAAYQLAVVVDDAAAGVNRIVRGDDLLESTARQMLLRELLGLGNDVRYWHVPLVVGQDGRRLAKRHGDTRLSRYRELGATSERLLGLLGYWSGLIDRRREATIDELTRRFDVSLVPRTQVVFTRADDEFLRKGLS
jgi:glutamyl-tRNA synthetase